VTFNVSGYNNRIEILKSEFAFVAPTQELSNGLSVSQPCVLVPDSGREEFQEPHHASFAGANDDRWHWLPQELGGQITATLDNGNRHYRLRLKANGFGKEIQVSGVMSVRP
jgi:hypothetical protein